MQATPPPILDARLSVRLGHVLPPLQSGPLPDVHSLIEQFLAPLQELPSYAGYKYLPPAVHAVLASVAIAGEDVSAAFLLGCLLTATRATLTGVKMEELTPRIRGHQLRQYERIAEHGDEFLRYCHLGDDVFLKELGLATLRLYAAASNVIDHRSGIGRSLLWRCGPVGLARRALFFARVGGFRPFFEVHVHKMYLEEFTEEGRKECYRCCAELYDLHPEILGMFAGSWFYDPAVAIISPHLAYLRDVPLAGGASIFFNSFNAQATANAIATSARRRALHATGQYRPAAYSLIWPRGAQIAWAQRNLV